MVTNKTAAVQFQRFANHRRICHFCVVEQRTRGHRHRTNITRMKQISTFNDVYFMVIIRQHASKETDCQRKKN